MIAAMLKLACNQVLLESRLDAHHHQIEDHEQRLEEIEQQLFPEDAMIWLNDWYQEIAGGTPF